MRKNIFVTFLVSFILISCGSSESKKWADLKKSGSVYLRDSLFKFMSVMMEDTSINWVNKAYNNFPYKEYCSERLRATFDATDTLIKDYLHYDSLSIANIMVSKFQKEGVAIFVGQTLDKNELNIYLYYENELNPFIILKDLGIPNNSEFVTDKEWESFGNLLLRNK